MGTIEEEKVEILTRCFYDKQDKNILLWLTENEAYLKEFDWEKDSLTVEQFNKL